MVSDNIVLAVSAFAGIVVICTALLKGWQGWLALRSHEIERQAIAFDRGSCTGTSRIELADLRERVRRLEAIAAGVDP